jgi:membrane protein required for colicin V production
MTAFDWAMAIVLLYSVVRAAMRGFVRTLFSLLGIIVGISTAAWGYVPLAVQLRPVIATQSTARAVAFALIVIGTIIVATIVGGALHRAASALGLSTLNRALGACFGVARGVVICVAALAGLMLTPTGATTVSHSLLAPYLLQAAHVVSFVMPQSVQQQLSQDAERIGHK